MSGASIPLGIPGIPGVPAAASSRDRSRAPSAVSQPSSSIAGEPAPAKNAQPAPASSEHCTGSRGTALGARRSRLNTKLQLQTSEIQHSGRSMSRASPADSAAPTSVTVSMARPQNNPQAPTFKAPAPVQPTSSQYSKSRGEGTGLREVRERERSPQRAPRVRATQHARPASSAGLAPSGARPTSSGALISYGPSSSGPYAQPYSSAGRAGRAASKAAPSAEAAPTSVDVPVASAGTMAEPASVPQISSAETESEGAAERRRQAHLFSTEHKAIERLHRENAEYLGDFEEDKRATSNTQMFIAKRSKFEEDKLERGVRLIERQRYGLKAAARTGNLKKYWEDRYKHYDSADDGSESDDGVACVPANCGIASDSDYEDEDED